MKGLYVYGSLLMVLSFTAGAISGNPALCALAIAACALAALSEALGESREGFSNIGMSMPSLAVAEVLVALLSWIVTACTAILAFLSFI